MIDLQVGEYYEVMCAVIVMDDDQTYDIPVFDHLHADPQFGFPDKHYHIDGRFELHPRMRHFFNLQSGCTSAVLIPEGSQVYRFIGIMPRHLKCTGLETGLSLPRGNDLKFELYQVWYDSYIGKSCAGRKCPHFGTEMLEKDGWLVCPMHNLKGDALTFKIV